MRTPPHVIAYRLVISSVSVLILLAFGFGLVGSGPFASLHRLASPVSHSLHLDRIGG
jgi:hypothetical protein